MHQKLIAMLFPDKKETGARLGAYGFFIAIVGCIFAFGGFTAVGYWIALTGALVGIGGIVMHLIVNWSTIISRGDQ